MKIHKNNTQGIENNDKSSPSRYVSEHLGTQWEIATHNSNQQLLILITCKLPIWRATFSSRRGEISQTLMLSV